MKKLLLTTVAVTAFATGASAMEAGKMYMRGDLGYQFKKYSDVKLKGFAGDIGFGYALSDNVRTDLTLNFSRPGKTKKFAEVDANMLKEALDDTSSKLDKTPDTGTKADLKTKIKAKNMGIMANAYYDFHNSSEFTPYLMAGIGVSRSSVEFKSSVNYKSGGSDVSQDLNTLKSKNLTSFNYQVGVGVGYEMSKDIHLDLGYKLSGMTGKYKTADIKDSNGKVVKKGGDKMANTCKSIHTISAGVRFAF